MELFCVFIAGVGVWGKQLSKPRALKSVTATICLAVAESQLPVFQLPWIQAGGLPRGGQSSVPSVYLPVFLVRV